MKKYIIVLFLFSSIFITNYSLSQWVQVQGGIGANHNITSLISTGNYIFAGSASGGGVFRSSDNGESWQSVNTGLTNANVSTLYFNNNILFAGTYGGGIFLSTNSGDSWNAASGGLTNLYVNCFYSFNSKIYAGTSDTLSNSGGVFVTSNSGVNWNFTGLTGFSVKAFTSNNNYLIAGTAYNGTTGGIFRTTNNGLNWAISNYGLLGFGIEVNALAADGSNIYAGTGTGVYLSTYNGTNWSSISIQLSSVKINCLAFYNFMFFAGTPNGIYMSTNYGVNWLSRNQGFPAGVQIPALLTTGSYIFSGTKLQSVWRRGINEIIGIKKISSEIPEKFLLEQNYPNPFNPATIIRYMIAENGKWKKENGLVTLKVYDILGKETATLVNKNQEPGIYEVNWDASSNPGGVYFYKLSIDNVQCSVKKMVLVK